MRWATPSEMLEILKTALGLICYIAMIFGAGWFIKLTADTIKEVVSERKERKAAEAEKARLEAWRRYNERIEILNDPDYYGEI